MMDDFRNTYEDEERAAAYAMLDYPGTYYLAFRDIPDIIARHLPHLPEQMSGRGHALDFGCGAGRSTRFLVNLGFSAVGIDISAQMIRKALELDPHGDYRRIPDGIFREIPLTELEGSGSVDADLPLPNAFFDLVLSAFTFDNIPTAEQKRANFREMKRVLAPNGRIVSIVSSPELYTHDWASFTCTGFAENFTAKNGDSVYTIMTDVPDARPVHDVHWDDEAYRQTYRDAGLEVDGVYRPLGREDEPYPWINETRLAPWVVYVLK